MNKSGERWYVGNRCGPAVHARVCKSPIWVNFADAHTRGTSENPQGQSRYPTHMVANISTTATAMTMVAAQPKKR